MNLLIQKQSNGITQKTWKITPKGHLFVVGGSKKADLYLPQSPDKVWLGLEARNQDWYLLNLANTESFIEQKIVTDLILKTSDFELKISPLPNHEAWHESTISDADSVLLINKVGSSIVDSKFCSLQEFSKLHPHSLAPAIQWQKLSGSGWSYKLSKSKLPDSHLLKANHWQFTKSDKWMFLLTVLIFVSGLLSYLLLPNHQSVEINLNQSIAPKVIRETKLKSKKNKEAQASQSGSNFIVSNPKQAPVPSHNSSRLSSLVSRINKQNQKSKPANFILSNPSAGIQNTAGSQLVTGIQNKDGSSPALVVGPSNSGEVGTLSRGAGGLAAKGNLNRISGIGGKVGMDILDAEADVEGGLDPEVIAQFIRARLGEILYCYERQLSINPALYGKVTTQFLIGSGGQVEIARVTQTSLKNASVESCVTQRIQKWKFPTPKGGSQVSVTYPFLFKNAQ